MSISANHALSNLIELSTDSTQHRVVGARNKIVHELISKCLFLDNQNVINKILCDTLRVYSHLSRDEPKLEDHDSQSDSLVQIVTLPPAKSYLNLAFLQLFEFLSKESSPSNETVIISLPKFVKQLRETFITLCLEDRKALKPSGHTKLSEFFIEELANDAIYLLSWSCIEAAKRITDSCEKTTSIRLVRFLALLKARLNSPVTFGTKLYKGYMVELIKNMDKVLTFTNAFSCSSKHKTNEPKSLLENDRLTCIEWLTEQRPTIARLSLLIDNPAECWRNITETMIHQASETNQLFVKNVSPTSSKSFEWMTVVDTMISCAKQLHDDDMLFGIETKLKVNECPAKVISVKHARHSLGGNYQRIFEDLKSSESIDGSSAIEFLNSCIELNLINDYTPQIENLESKFLQDLYKSYSESKDTQGVKDMRHWLSTWTEMPQDFGLIPMRNQLDLIIPTCLNNLVKSSKIEQVKLIADLEGLLSVELLTQSLTSYPNDNLKVYKALLTLVKGDLTEFEKLAGTHKDDLHWNQLCNRCLEDLNLYDSAKTSSQVFDLINLRAAKYHHKNNNNNRANSIIDSLLNHTSNTENSIIGKLLLVKMNPDSIEDDLEDISSTIEKADLGHNSALKEDLLAKVMRHRLRCHFTQTMDDIDELDSPDNAHKNSSWHCATTDACLETRIRTLSLFSRQVRKQLEKLPDCCSIINLVFATDIKLLVLLGQSGRHQDQSSAIECAIRLVNSAINKTQIIKVESLDLLVSSEFLSETIRTWTSIKNNLISLAKNTENIAGPGYSVLYGILKFIALRYPDLMIYSIVVNHIDAQVDGVDSVDDEALQSNPSSSSLLDSEAVCSNHEVMLWNDIHDSLSKQDVKWLNKYNDTKAFVKELRRISFLSGEYCEKMIVRLTKALYKFRDSYESVCRLTTSRSISKQDSSDLLKISRAICKRSLRETKSLIQYARSFKQQSVNLYDETFSETFMGPLNKLRGALADLYIKENLTTRELQCVTELIKIVQDLHHDLRAFQDKTGGQNIFLRLISPMLSDLRSNLIPMPDTISPRESQVTIQAISNTVNLITSLHSPKKLKFTGSDGVSRMFLLKAHEDLRQDQLVMDLFSTIDCLLAGNKETQNNYRIRRYVVTPVSSRSGLIQCIEAASMNTLYQDWLNSSKGREKVRALYSSTCEVVCESKKNHENCDLPQRLQGTDLFYQLIWSLTDFKSRPGYDVWRELREVLDASVFRRVTEQLTAITPRDLISRKFWLESRDAYAYWHKTQNFIRSCAIMSMVGYVIGLGDRHTGNILLDYNTGEVVHIDYGICFESAPYVEKVPFRLTQNLVHGFGFAGLEGGFTLSCRRVLRLLRKSESVIEHLLHPVNLAFMIDPSIDLIEQGAEYDWLNANCKSNLSKLRRHAVEDLEMCSQESVVVDPIKKQQRDIDDLMILATEPKPNDEHSTGSSRRRQKSLLNIEHEIHAVPPKNAIYLQVKEPKKISVRLANSRYNRIKDKLAGTDDQLRRKYRRRDQMKQLLLNCDTTRTDTADKVDEKDLIILNDTQSIEEQVDALILESISLANLAAMYEGWKAWV